MIYIKNIKGILKKALASNDKAEIVDIFKKFQGGPTPEMIDECADVARSHLASLHADICEDIKFFVSDKERGLGDLAAYCILYAHDVSVEYRHEDQVAEQDNSRKHLDIIEQMLIINRWPAFCLKYFEKRAKYVSGLRKCESVLQTSTIHHMLENVIKKGYYRQISSTKRPLRIIILPYRKNGEDSSYFPNENLVATTVARKFKDAGDPRSIFLHEVGHTLHNHIIYPEGAEKTPVVSFLPIYDMLFTNLLTSEEEISIFAENFADCFSVAVSIGDDELYGRNPFSKVFDRFTVQVLDFYFREISSLSNLAEAGSNEFWHEEHKGRLIKFLCDYDLDRTKDKYSDIVCRLGRAIKIQAERGKEMNIAEMLYDCFKEVYMYHHDTQLSEVLPFEEALNEIKKIF